MLIIWYYWNTSGPERETRSLERSIETDRDRDRQRDRETERDRETQIGTSYLVDTIGLKNDARMISWMDNFNLRIGFLQGNLALDWNLIA